jgi:hypothetical protein
VWLTNVVIVGTVRPNLSSSHVMRNKGQSYVEIDSQHPENKNRKGNGGCDAGEDSERNSDDEEKGHNESVDGIEECHFDSDVTETRLVAHDYKEIPWRFVQSD